MMVVNTKELYTLVMRWDNHTLLQIIFHTGNLNGNCVGNCEGAVAGNGDGNDNIDGKPHGNHNGNCVGKFLGMCFFLVLESTVDCLSSMTTVSLVEHSISLFQ